VGVAVTIEKSSENLHKKFRIAGTGLQSKPLRLYMLEQMVASNNGVIEKLGKIVDESIKDVRLFQHQNISVIYRKYILKILLEQTLADCMANEREVK
jgi:CO/xanthine dehydrogenase FAD-binding subunit